jgi:hypothetical protein
MEKFQGFEVKGRKLALDFALKRDRKQSKKNATEAQKPSEASAATVEKEQPKAENVIVDESEPKTSNEEDSATHIQSSRQILAFGIPIDVNKKVFKSVLQKLSRKALVELVKEVST